MEKKKKKREKGADVRNKEKLIFWTDDWSKNHLTNLVIAIHILFRKIKIWKKMKIKAWFLNVCGNVINCSP